jgi:hypothetical protein
MLANLQHAEYDGWPLIWSLGFGRSSILLCLPLIVLCVLEKGVDR